MGSGSRGAWRIATGRDKRRSVGGDGLPGAVQGPARRALHDHRVEERLCHRPVRPAPAHQAGHADAVQNLEQGQGGDPEFLGRAKEEAKPFTLNEGETKAVDIKLSQLVP